MHDSFSDSSPSSSGATRPGLALAVAALAAAGLTGAVVGGLAWAVDHYSAAAEAPLDVSRSAGPVAARPAGTANVPGTPGWAESVAIPAPVAGAAQSTDAGPAGSGGGAVTAAKSGPVPGRHRAPDVVGTDTTTDTGDPHPDESADPGAADPQPSASDDPGPDESGDPATDEPSPDESPSPAPGSSDDPVPAESGDGPDPADSGAGASSSPAPSESATPRHRWFIFRHP